MTRHTLGRCAFAAVLVAILVAPLAPQEANAQVKPEMAFQFGPQVGYDLSPDAFTLGAFAMVHNALVNMPALKFMIDAAYGIGTEDLGVNIDYNTFRIAVTALYLLSLTDSNLAILPLAGLAYYRLSVSTSNQFFGSFGASGSDIALVLGGMVMINQLWFRATLNAGGASDLSASVGYTFGSSGAE